MTGLPADSRGVARMIWDTALRPADVARRLLPADIPTNVIWMGLALATVLSALLAVGLQALMPMPDMPEGQPEPVTFSPLVYGLILGGSLILSAFAFHFTGRALGGQGTLPQALLAVTWLQLLLIPLQVLQALIALALPGLGLVAAVAILIIGLRATVVFLQVLHGFDGIGRAILTLILASLAMGAVLFILALAMPGGFS